MNGGVPLGEAPGQPGAEPLSAADEAVLAEAAASVDSAVEKAVAANMAGLIEQFGAVLTLLTALPLVQMLAVNKRTQTTSVLTLPANVTAEQAAMLRHSLRRDQKIFEAAIALARIATTP